VTLREEAMMLTSREADSVGKLLSWLSVFEETILFQDYVQQGTFTREEFESVWVVLDAAVRRARSQSVSSGGNRLFRIFPQDTRCRCCNWNGSSCLYVLAKSEDQANQLYEAGDAGLCETCIFDVLEETNALLYTNPALK
jgi:hypothetical protein